MAEVTKKSEKKTNADDNAEAAVEEVKDAPEPKIVKVKDREFRIPDQQPAELLFAARSASRAARTKNESGAVEAMLDMAAAYIGEDELRDLMSESSVEEGIEIVQDLLDAAGEAYGTDQGESSASAKS